jgi:NAD(P)-dependent dehydrogenase (short-subunit alcohol dehydrogenase family)
MPKWTATDIPDQSGRTVLITGANSGLGLAAAGLLAGRGARVLMACRSPERGEQALRTVTEGAAAGGSAELVRLNLADLGSVHQAAKDIRARTGDRLDVLMNNAGVMMTPKQRTTDGFELQFGTNHLGHAALTWLLMPALRASKGARVVTLSSLAARPGQVDIADPNYEHRSYLPNSAYAQSKLANLLFALELDRHAGRAGLDLISVAAHPGYTATSLIGNMARSRGRSPIGAAIAFFGGIGDRLVGQNVWFGVLPQVYAATAPDVRGGEYFGPDGLFEMRGHPHRVAIPKQGQDPDLAARLWRRTAELTKVDPDPA